MRLMSWTASTVCLRREDPINLNRACPRLVSILPPPPKPVSDVMKANADKVEQFRSGKTKLQGFFVGQAVALSGGKADPELTGEVARRLLEVVEVD